MSFFGYSFDSATSLDSYPGLTVSDGNKLIDMVITTKNTFGETIEMYAWDYQLQWGSRDNSETFAETFEAVDEDMAPEIYELGDGATITFHYVFEAPADVKDFELCYLEEFDGEEEAGDIVSRKQKSLPRNEGGFFYA